jgi:threonine dehydratase
MKIALDVPGAYARIRPNVVRTPLEYSPEISRLTGVRVFLKWECDQATGSFKWRGALNKIRGLTAPEKMAGIIAASTGNHGLGVARAAALEGTTVTLYLPKTAAPAKIEKLRKTGVAIEFHGASCEQAEAAAREEAVNSGRVYVSPYNDPEVVAGQGTLGLEILEDCPEATAVFVPIGGGGLIAGIGTWIKSQNSDMRIVGVEPFASAFMRASLRAGRLVSIAEGRTLADAVAGGIEPGSITFPLCRDCVDEIVLTGEAGLKEALVLLYKLHGRVVEGAGALPLAALRKSKARFRGRTVVLVASGGNIDPVRFAKIVGDSSIRRKSPR